MLLPLTPLPFVTPRNPTPPPTPPPAGFMWLEFSSDNSISKTGFVLNYTTSASPAPPLPCDPKTTAVLTSVLDTRNTGSDVSWAIATVRPER